MRSQDLSLQQYKILQFSSWTSTMTIYVLIFTGSKERITKCLPETIRISYRE